MNTMDIDVLRRLITYNPDTGLLTWNEREITGHRVACWNSQSVGKPALNCIGKWGYRSGMVLGRLFKAHRVAWALFHGEWPKDYIDHINGDKADNRIKNLRSVSQSENAKNARLFKNNSSGACGVYRYRDQTRWYASIRADGRTKHLGIFASFDDALRARKIAERDYGFHENHGSAA